MKRLEDIPKKSIFRVPEGYFDQLPTTIQSRIAERRSTSTRFAVSFSLKYALPVVALVVVGIFWLRPERSLEEKLDEIDTEQIALYLENTERIDIDDDPTGLTSFELDELENAVLSDMEYNEEFFEELDLENL